MQLRPGQVANCFQLAYKYTECGISRIKTCSQASVVRESVTHLQPKCKYKPKEINNPPPKHNENALAAPSLPHSLNNSNSDYSTEKERWKQVVKLPRNNPCLPVHPKQACSSWAGWFHSEGGHRGAWLGVGEAGAWASHWAPGRFSCFACSVHMFASHLHGMDSSILCVLRNIKDSSPNSVYFTSCPPPTLWRLLLLEGWGWLAT